MPDQPVVYTPPTAPATQPEESPEAPRWAPLHAVAAFFTGVVVALVLAGILAAIAGVDPEEDSPAVTIVGTIIMDGAFVASALLFASLVARPRAWQFGLRGTRLWPAVGWATLGLLSFYVFSLIYAALVQPDTEQRVTESLGADRGTAGLIVAGLMVIVVAPAAEEFFFRGFFYRALRSRFGVVVAAALDGALFGAIHFNGVDSLALIPVFALLGFMFCLVFERTGSLYPVIALHAINNSVAYAVQADGAAVSAVLAPLTVAACILVPRVMRSAPPPPPALP